MKKRIGSTLEKNTLTRADKVSAFIKLGGWSQKHKVWLVAERRLRAARVPQAGRTCECFRTSTPALPSSSVQLELIIESKLLSTCTQTEAAEGWWWERKKPWLKIHSYLLPHPWPNWERSFHKSISLHPHQCLCYIRFANSCSRLKWIGNLQASTTFPCPLLPSLFLSSLSLGTRNSFSFQYSKASFPSDMM